MNNTEIKKKLENDWYIKSGFNKKHFLNNPLFYSPKRNDYAYKTAKQLLGKILNKAGINSNSKLLLAPCGIGDDFCYIEGNVKDIYGIDISDEAVSKIKYPIKATVGDIQSMPFENGYFDFILSILFFHHIIDEGFDAYLKEVKRILKKDGYLIILEPSSLYPIHWISRLIISLVGNITGAVPTEKPLNPLKLEKSLIDNGFKEINVFSATYTYHRFPIFLSAFFRLISPLFSRIPFIKYCGWLVYFIARNK